MADDPAQERVLVRIALAGEALCASILTQGNSPALRRKATAARRENKIK